MLFSDQSLYTMLHGIVLSGGGLVMLFTALFSLRAMSANDRAAIPASQANAFVWVTIAAAVLLWLSVISGTYVIFPVYRLTPPEGIASLVDYPRALLLSRPDTRWLHSFAMEVKEHVPWMAAMLTTAVAFMARRHRATVLADGELRKVAGWLLVISLVLVSYVALLGVFVNKVAPVW